MVWIEYKTEKTEQMENKALSISLLGLRVLIAHGGE